jgi:hypothetical protein
VPVITLGVAKSMVMAGDGGLVAPAAPADRPKAHNINQRQPVLLRAAMANIRKRVKFIKGVQRPETSPFQPGIVNPLPSLFSGIRSEQKKRGLVGTKPRVKISD